MFYILTKKALTQMHNKINQFSSLHYSLCHTFILFCLCLFVFFFCYLFPLIFSLSLTLVIDNFCCLDYTLLLHHTITSHLVLHLSLSPIVFIVSTLIIGIFYCLNYTLLLLQLIITHLLHAFYYNYVINIYPRQLL